MMRISPFSILLSISIAASLAAPAFSQSLTVGNKQLNIQEGSQLTFDNLTSENATLIVIPGEGSAIAEVQMVDASRTIFFFGKKITIEQKTTDFQLEGDARIQWDKNMLSGPVSIIFDSASDTLILSGTKTNPAAINYTDTPFKGKAETFHIIGKRVNGNWTPNRVISSSLLEQANIFLSSMKKAAKPEAAQEPKLTTPKTKK
jgi:hypothetical protein